MKWTSVNDGLPDTTERVLVTDGKGESLIVVYMKYKGEIEHGKFRHLGEDLTDVVTHWMLLPEIPKYEANNE